MRVIIALLLIVLVAAPAMALSTTLAGEYSPRETVIIRFDGIILEPIAYTDVQVLRNGHVSVPVDYDVRQIDERQFLWFITPESPGNYTLSISDIATSIEGVKRRVSYRQNFTLSGNISQYTIKPGFIDTQYNFTINLESRSDVPEKISISLPYPHDEVVYPGMNEFRFASNEFQQEQITTMAISHYSLPIFIRGNTTVLPPVTSPLECRPASIWERINQSDSLSPYEIELINHGNKDIKNVVIDYNKQLFTVKPDSFGIIRAEQVMHFNISIKKKPSASFSETLSVRAGDISIPLLLEIVVSNETSERKIMTGNTSSYCADLGGALCEEGTQCSGAVIASRDGSCCTAACVQPQKQSSAWIGYTLGAVVLIGLTLLWLRYKGVSGKNTFAERVASAEKKFP